MDKPLFDVLSTDRLFSDSPDAGDPNCLCSRCGLLIECHEMPIRAWPMRNAGPEEAIGEYRFHDACLGIKTFDDGYDDQYPDEFYTPGQPE